ncbi:MAG: hypothetical protein COB09_19030 [Thalassobium sp.]|nr:MAG: hypothetical protein COB09_19030 [Thalassobium sp.]
MILRIGTIIYSADGTDEEPVNVEDARKWAKSEGYTANDVSIRKGENSVIIKLKRNVEYE